MSVDDVAAPHRRQQSSCTRLKSQRCDDNSVDGTNASLNDSDALALTAAHLVADIAACCTPLDYFYLIVTPADIEDLVAQTNAAAAADTQYAFQWKTLTADELRAFLGCLVFMGGVQFPHLAEYWDSLTEQPVVAKTFSLHRFRQISHYFYLNASSSADVLSEPPSGYRYRILYRPRHKWQRLAFYMFNIAVLNAFIIYKENTSDSRDMTQWKFAGSLQSKLRGNFSKPTIHTPERRRTADACCVCGVTPRWGRRSLNIGCRECAVPLCFGDCFETHWQQNI